MARSSSELHSKRPPVLYEWTASQSGKTGDIINLFFQAEVCLKANDLQRDLNVALNVLQRKKTIADFLSGGGVC